MRMFYAANMNYYVILLSSNAQRTSTFYLSIDAKPRHQLRHIHLYSFKAFHLLILICCLILFWCTCVLSISFFTLDGRLLLDNCTNNKLFIDTGTQSGANSEHIWFDMDNIFSVYAAKSTNCRC